MNEQRLILVTGATGKQGGATLRHLRKHGFPVRALVRDPNKHEARQLAGQGVQVVKGTFEDIDSLRRALDGVYGVFCMSTFAEGGVEAESQQGYNMIEAAQRSRVSHFVYSSVGGADQNTGVPHFDSKFRVEERLRASGLPYSILRPSFFMENWVGMREMLEQGSLIWPLSPQTKLQQIAVDDIGGLTALSFANEGRWLNRALDISGDERTCEEIAREFSRVLSRDVRYVQVPWDALEQQISQEMALMFHWFEDHGYTADIPAVRAEYPDLMTFPRWLNVSGWNYRTE
ncbi:MAG TPA: NmrA/HSCARG family protein [Bryobacteraceae bacterium]|jgi:uncharacterized protein YbjT (DUF2867 family)|nr:NmrA/HSCARG family protein [Bryobacteraceae bacterium]